MFRDGGTDRVEAPALLGEPQHWRIPPETFEPIVSPGFGPEEVYNNVEVIEQDPLECFPAFSAWCRYAPLAGGFLDGFGYSP